MDEAPSRLTRWALFLLFLRHGLLAWGGPVPQIERLHRELVVRDGWISEERFRKVLAIYQALPGPEAHELTVYLGMTRGGRLGGFLAGLGFMLPGVLLVTTLAALYVRFASTMEVGDAVLHGVRPVVVALILTAMFRLLKRTVERPLHLLLFAGAATVGALFPDFSVLLILAVAGVVALLVSYSPPGSSKGAALVPLLGAATFPALTAAGLWALAATSAKVGLLTFGGAYTAIPFLHEDAVIRYGWLTEGEFLDALALASIVPGPLIAIGTFVGYQVAGLAGAALATILIFAPAFAFTLVGHGIFERVVDDRRLHAFLLGVTAAVIGLIFASSYHLYGAALVDAFSVAWFLIAFLLLAFKVAPVPVVLLAGAALGTSLEVAHRFGLVPATG